MGDAVFKVSYFMAILILAGLSSISIVQQKWNSLVLWGLLFIIAVISFFVVLRIDANKSKKKAKKKSSLKSEKAKKKKTKRKTRLFAWITRKGKKKAVASKKSSKKKSRKKTIFAWLSRPKRRKAALKEKPKASKKPFKKKKWFGKKLFKDRKEKTGHKAKWFSKPKALKIYKAKEQKKEKEVKPSVVKKQGSKKLKIYKAPEKEEENTTVTPKQFQDDDVELIEINKPKEAAKTDKMAVKTDFDKVYEFVQNKGEVKFSEVAKKFKMEKEKVTEWAKLLEEHELVEVVYPTFGEPRLKRREND